MAATLRGLRWTSSLRPVTSSFFQSQQQSCLRPAVYGLIHIQPYSTRPLQPNQSLIRDHGVFANYVPPEKTPSVTDFQRWRLTKWRNLKNSVSNLLSVGLIKYKSQYDTWNSGKFLSVAEETYKDMNDAFARGDRSMLEEVCLDAMYSNLKNQIKQRNQARWEWRYHGEVETPKIVCVRCMSATGVSKHGFAVAQVTVRMFTKQSMAVFDKKNRLIGGDPEKIHNVLEYVVFQKTISDAEDFWRIYGKIAAPEKIGTQ
ncbi:39S ribosomal protein L45, mitochondrial [Apophysomyces ossiformis]|uniref:Large ribosomal subunit protein mL45 n=1 Tax=Apophysomyces ossiformis TaxID=679940 RepID=A0A8H7BUR5_9FUNG|nr:39S ribosomal protein L45, mitochondrial [Apophysomyces ossiformis]